MRDLLIIVGVCIGAIVIGLFLFLFGTVSEPRDTFGPVSFSVIAEGNTAGDMTKKKNYRVQNREELVAVWEAVYPAEAPPMPDVEFSRNEVLALFAGEQMSGGYGVGLESVISREDGKRLLTIIYTEPSSSCFVTEQITSPFQVVVLPKADAEVVREDKTVVVSCE